MPLVHVIPCASLSLASSVAGGSARYLHGRRLVGGYRHGARTSSWSWRRRDAVPAHAGMGAGSRGRRRERSRRSALAPSEANATGAVRVRVRPHGSGWGVGRTGAGEPRVMASGEAERRPVRGTGVVGSQHGWRCGARRLEREGIRAAEGRPSLGRRVGCGHLRTECGEVAAGRELRPRAARHRGRSTQSASSAATKLPREAARAAWAGCGSRPLAGVDGDLAVSTTELRSQTRRARPTRGGDRWRPVA
jgi:hypothetical protein